MTILVRVHTSPLRAPVQLRRLHTPMKRVYSTQSGPLEVLAADSTGNGTADVLLLNRGHHFDTMIPIPPSSTLQLHAAA